MEQSTIFRYVSEDCFQIDQIRRIGPSDMAGNHFHDRYEIYYLVSGERQYFIKDRTYNVEKGGLVLIDQMDLHKTSHGAGNAHERILIEFKKEFLGEHVEFIRDVDLFSVFSKGSAVLSLGFEEQKYIEGIFFRIIREAKSRQEGFETSIKIAMVELLIYLCRYRKQLLEANHTKHSDEMNERIFDIVKYINNNYMNEITLPYLCEKFYISRYYLSRSFKKATGFSFIEYLNCVRVREAQILLQDTEGSITHIAGRVGYDSVTHFGRVFKSITSFSPLRYRKIHTSGIR